MSYSQSSLSSHIEPDSNSPPSTPSGGFPSGNIGSSSDSRPPAPREQLLPTNTAQSGAAGPQRGIAGGVESEDEGVVGMFKQSSHPVRPNILPAVHVWASPPIQACRLASTRRAYFGPGLC